MSDTDTRARLHLSRELGGIVRMLAHELASSRRRGRSPASDALRAFVIEGGEAEQLVNELRERWGTNDEDARGGWSAQASAKPLPARTVAAAPADLDLPLSRVVGAFELREDEYVALLVALAVELDAGFGRLIAFLNDHVGRTRPTLGLVQALASQDRKGGALRPHNLLRGRAVQDGLLEVEGDGPLPGMAVRVAQPMIARLCGEGEPPAAEGGVRFEPPDLGRLHRLVIPDRVRRSLEAWSASVRDDGKGRPLVLIGAPGVGRRTVACAAAGEAGASMTCVEVSGGRVSERLRAARRDACWHRSGLVLEVEKGSELTASDWSELWSCAAPVPGPLVIVCRPADEAALYGCATQELATVAHLPPPTREERIALWRRLLPAGTVVEDSVLEDLAGRFRFDARRTSHAVRHALSSLAVAEPGARTLSAASLTEACKHAGSLSMSSLAQRLTLPYTWEQLIVPAFVRDELKLAVAWIQRQHQVLDNWGFGERIVGGSAATMLLSGAPGVGKTMAAQVLAREIGIDLYRVDLSRVMNKYVGETEKQLARLFDEAEASGAMLFFDEAEALFGKRGERKDAHDLYANIQVGYLLQRMESFEGPTVLSTNRPGDLDEAFARRFQFRIEIPAPGAEQRLLIWRGMIPAQAEQEADLGLEALAHEFDVTGGEIKNAALAAAYAATTDERPIGREHLWRAVQREMRKGGRVVDGG